MKLSRRSLIAVIGSTALAGCSARSQETGEDDPDLEDDDVQEESDDVASIEVAGSEILDEEQLLEISIRPWGEFDVIQYLEGDDLEEIEPARDRWLQLTITVNDLREVDISERLEIPGVEALEGAVVQTGEVLEPVSWTEKGLDSEQIRADVRPFEEANTPAQGDSTWVAPLFDAPAQEIAVDVAPILGQDEEIWLQPD